MKKKTVTALLITLVSTVLIGCKTRTTNTVTGNTVSTAQNTTHSIAFDNVEVYRTTTQTEFDALTDILENRNGKIIIEVSNGTVLDDDGNGTTTCGYYQKYDIDRFSKNDKVQSIFIYNPCTNAVDDILYRVDTLIQ